MKKAVSTGLLLFGIFFGAGNLIFPPALGLFAGPQLWPAVIGFIITGVGIAVLTLVLGTLINGNYRAEIDRKFHPLVSVVYLAALYLSIGPFFAIPRTASTSFSIAIQPLLPGNDWALYLYCVLYFALAYWIALNPSKLLDRVGKIMTPIFAGMILLLVVVGAIKYAGQTPMEATPAYESGKAFTTGFLEGYNTLDALAAIAFTVIAVNTFKQFGFTSLKEYKRTVVGVGVFTALAFSVLYLGLAFLGNHFTVPADVIADESVHKGAYILTMASRLLFGRLGQTFLSVMVILTCFTTTVGLIVSTAEFFMELFPSVSYKLYATLFTLISLAIACLGLNTVIQFSIPVLLVLYPITMILVAIILVNKFLPLSSIGMWISLGLVTFLSLVTVLSDSLGWTGLQNLLGKLPLASLSLGWLLPGLLTLVLAFLLPGRQKGQAFDFDAVYKS